MPLPDLFQNETLHSDWDEKYLVYLCLACQMEIDFNSQITCFFSFEAVAWASGRTRHLTCIVPHLKSAMHQFGVRRTSFHSMYFRIRNHVQHVSLGLLFFSFSLHVLQFGDGRSCH